MTDARRAHPLVAVDGPAGSGKSSVCSEVCRRLGWTHFSSGVLYRATGLLTVRAGDDIQDAARTAAWARRLGEHGEISVVEGRLHYAGEDISHQLGTEAISHAASVVAAQPGVREALLPAQRRLAAELPSGVMLDGRDIGTVVFPDADLKVFLTADVQARAQRRRAQLASRDPQASLPSVEEIAAQLRRRDEQDAGRTLAPLRCPDDAVTLNTSQLSYEEAVSAFIELLIARALVAPARLR